MSEWTTTRKQFKSERIASKSNRRFYYCESPLNKQTATYDHVLPRALGGKTTVENLVLACQPCNQEKSAMTIDQYRELKGGRPFYGETLLASSAPSLLPR